MGHMKTTLDIPDTIFRRSKAMAALSGQSLREFVSSALVAHLERKASTTPGWQEVFGKASPEAIEDVDRIIAEEFGRVDPEDWR